MGLALPPVVNASSGTLTNATETPDHMHGWLSGSVTWDECSSKAQCWWDAAVIVKPAAEPCSVHDLQEATSLDDGEAISSIYYVSASGGWLENGTIKIGGIGFPAVVGQQACLEVNYKVWSGGSEQYQGIVLAARPFVFEQSPASPSPSAPPAPTSTPPDVPHAVTPQPPTRLGLTRAQRMGNALKQCRRRFHRKHRRLVCERRARKKYGPLRHTGQSSRSPSA